CAADPGLSRGRHGHRCGPGPWPRHRFWGGTPVVTDQLHALVRRYPIVRLATERLRTRLPRRVGGLDPDQLPPSVRRFPLELPRTQEGPATGQDRVGLELPGDLTVPRRLEGFGLAQHEPGSLSCFLAAGGHAEPGAVLDIGSGVGVYAA